MSRNNLKSLNIENLFTTGTNKPHTNGKLDVNTLFKNNPQNSEFTFSADSLLNGVRKRRTQLENTHDDIFKGCWSIISSANEAGLTDIIYEVPQNVVECTDYDSLECLKFIKKKLFDERISTHIIPKSRTKIFITWKDIEQKLKERDEEIARLESINMSPNINDSIR